jgi:hypothetical protein
MLSWIQQNVELLSSTPQVVIGLGMVAVVSVILYALTRAKECLVCSTVAMAYAVPMMFYALS